MGKPPATSMNLVILIPGILGSKLVNTPEIADLTGIDFSGIR